MQRRGPDRIVNHQLHPGRAIAATNGRDYATREGRSDPLHPLSRPAVAAGQRPPPNSIAPEAIPARGGSQYPRTVDPKTGWSKATVSGSVSLLVDELARAVAFFAGPDGRVSSPGKVAAGLDAAHRRCRRKIDLSISQKKPCRNQRMSPVSGIAAGTRRNSQSGGPSSSSTRK